MSDPTEQGIQQPASRTRTDDELEQLKAKVEALEAKIAALTQPQPKPKGDVARLDPPFPKSTYDAIDRMANEMAVSKEERVRMAKAVPTEMVQQIVRDGKR